jgi:hypothetical protein
LGVAQPHQHKRVAGGGRRMVCMVWNGFESVVEGASGVFGGSEGMEGAWVLRSGGLVLSFLGVGVGACKVQPRSTHPYPPRARQTTSTTPQDQSPPPTAASRWPPSTGQPPSFRPPKPPQNAPHNAPHNPPTAPRPGGPPLPGTPPGRWRRMRWRAARAARCGTGPGPGGGVFVLGGSSLLGWVFGVFLLGECGFGGLRAQRAAVEGLGWF